MKIYKSLNHIPVKLYNPETLNYRTRILAAGGSISESTLDAIEKFVQDCKNSNIWDKLLDVGPFAGGSLASALVKLAYPGGVSSTLTNINFVSGDYIETGVNGGLAADGATKFLNTGFNLQNLLPDNCHFSFYLREDVSVAGNRSLVGAVNGVDQYWLGALTNSQTNARLGQALTATHAQNMSKGYYIASRQEANSLKLFKNGDLVGSDSTAVVHNKPNTNAFVFAFSNAGIGGAFIPGRGAFYSIGQALSDAEARLLHEAVQTLQRNLGREVN